MNKLFLFVLVMTFMGTASGVSALTCPSEMAEKTSCISGEKMLCSKKYNPVSNELEYEWEAVNVSGQAFQINNPLYKKVPGLTPAFCAESRKS
jgi:hypothetical protein